MNLEEYKTNTRRRKKTIEYYNKCLDGINEVYIQTNAPYPPGTKLRIKDYGKTFETTIHYEVNDGELVSKFMTLEGKHLFTDKPQIIKEL